MHPITAFGIFGLLMAIFLTVSSPDPLTWGEIGWIIFCAIGYALLEHQEDS